MFRNLKKYKKIIISSILILTVMFSSYMLIPTSLKKQLHNKNYEDSNKYYVYLSDLWDTKYLVSKESSWKDARALKVNQNEPGNLISLIINGEKKYFLNGIFAHATSTIIYDVSEYQEKGYNTFSAYLGVDTYASSNGNGVKFTIYGSNNKDDQSSWTKLTSTGVMMGISEALNVTLNIKGYNYLIFYANDNGSNASDHAVYADAMIYNSNEYTKSEPKEIDFVKKVSEYDNELLKKSDSEIITNSNDRLSLLQRTFVSKVDYNILQAWANSNSDNLEVLEWLFKDEKRLEQYILGGSPTGSYIKSLTVLSEIYKKHKEDFASSNITSKTLQKLMFATSLTHSTTIQSWFSGENGAKVYSTGLGRYEAIKELYLGAKNGQYWKQKTNDGTAVPYRFEWEQFEDLQIEEMRWVTDNNLSDEEFLWLNWYATITKMGKTQYSNTNLNDRGEMNPYTYIFYGNGGNVGRDDYYTSSPMCGYKNEFYDSSKRTESCYEKYQLNDWSSLKTQTKSKPTLWIAFEEDGVCGTLMHVGANLERVFGIPSAGLGQPGHGAYIYANRVKNNQTGKYYTDEWRTYNWVSGWDQSEKGERLLLNWGTRNKSTVFNSTYNLIYIPLAQQALNDYEKYRISELYMLMADVQTKVDQKEKYYNLALDKIPYHVTAWYRLLTLEVSQGMSSSELNVLGQKMMNNVGNAPTAIDELSNIIEDHLGNELGTYKHEQKRILTDLSTTTDSKYMNVNGVNQVAKRLLGTVDNLDVATFSFDGKDANILKLLGIYADVNSSFEYSLDYTHNPATGEFSGTWIRAEGISADLTDKLDKINSINDITVHILKDENRSPNNVYVIDITNGSSPTGLYANDLENKVIGATNNMEWKFENEEGKWTKFKDDTKFEGQKSVLVRNSSSGTALPSDYVKLTFALDPEADLTKSYISISRLSANASSWQGAGAHPKYAIDGNPNTIWHNYWDLSDQEKWIAIEVNDGPVEISKIDYVPRSGGGNGNYTKVKIETSLDGINYDFVENVAWGGGSSTKTYYFENPTLAKFVRLTALESVGNFASAAMINLYENKVPHTISVDDLSVSYMSGGYVYNGNIKTPLLTVKYQNELILGKDYKVEYKDNINAGTGKIILTGLGIYTGTREFDFTISKAKQPDLMPKNEMFATTLQDTLEDLTDLPEGWSWKNPKTNLKSGETIDAILEYKDKNNYEIYEVIVKVTQDLGYRPVITGPEERLIFDISDEENIKTLDYLINLVKITDVEDDRDNKKLDIQINYDWEGQLDWTKEATHHIDFIVTDSDGNVSKYTLQFTIIKTDNPRIEINNKDFDILVKGSLEYTGDKLIPAITITDSDNHVLKEGADYILKFSDNVNAGTATVIIEGVGIYTGSFIQKFTIKKASIPAVLPASTITISIDTKSLSEINLPTGWRWANENVKLINGRNVLKLVYSGDENHDPYELEIVVMKDGNVNEPSDDNKENNQKPNSTNNEDKNKDSGNSNSTSKNVNNSNISSSNTAIIDETTIDNNDSNDTNDSNIVKDKLAKENEKIDYEKEESKDSNKFLLIICPILIIIGILSFVIWKKR